jgi:chromosome partitioning protein
MATHAAHVIVLGNEKGGSGKSTIALHLAVGLMQHGFNIAVADFDERQRSLFRYIENRRVHAAECAAALPCPEIYEPPAIDDERLTPLQRIAIIDEELRSLCRRTDFLVIDTPGSVTDVARLAHSFADTLITPMNDSLIDLDVLARIGAGTSAILAPSQYSYLVLELRRRRLRNFGAGLDWIVLRNRIAPIASANNERIGRILAALAPKLGFRVAPGVLERVIYRELFLTGATVLDPIDVVAGLRLTMSHIAARMEVRRIIEALWLPQVSPDSQPEAEFSPPPNSAPGRPRTNVKSI